jgi:kynureninase
MSAANLFTRAAAAAPKGRLHFAAHSHHAWPDAVVEAHIEYAEQSIAQLDGKWGPIFSELWPRLQGRIAARLGLPDPATLAFSPNTHDFLIRIVSCFEGGRTLRVLTTDAEFHSVSRQLERWLESGRVKLEVVPAEPFTDFHGRFSMAAAQGGHDLIVFSHVFYDSGYVVPDLAGIVDAVPSDDTLVVIDGYHGFNAIPVELRAVAARAFYMAGAYKYAMAGEGCCFLHAPPGFCPRPELTGWFAGFGDLEGGESSAQVGFATDGTRFLGSTFDPVAMVRLDAALGVLDATGWPVERIHEHVVGLQAQFVAGLPAEGAPLSVGLLVPGLEVAERGHFLVFQVEDAQGCHDLLAEAGVMTDHRKGRLRFGFAIYHDAASVDDLLARCRRVGLLG